jgi:phosphoglycerate dehydrogenase-like enzyme
MKILICSDAFPSARKLLGDRLPSGDEIIVANGPDLRGQLRRADVVIPMMTPLGADQIDATGARLIQQWGSGLEGIDLAAAAAKNVRVANVPSVGSNADSVAEHVLLLILALLRQLPLAQENVRLGILGAPLGRTLAGRTVCLYGLGATAHAIARRLRGFNVRLIGISRRSDAAKVSDFGLDRCYGSSERLLALAETHVLIVCLRQTEETRGLVDAAALAALPAGAYVVNAARGALIDYDALHGALSSGHLGGAGLDVYWKEPIASDDPLIAAPNVIATPHIAGVTDRSYAEIADAVAANIERLRRGEEPLNRAA